MNIPQLADTSDLHDAQDAVDIPSLIPSVVGQLLTPLPDGIPAVDDEEDDEDTAEDLLGLLENAQNANTARGGNGPGHSSYPGPDERGRPCRAGGESKKERPYIGHDGVREIHDGSSLSLDQGIVRTTHRLHTNDGTGCTGLLACGTSTATPMEMEHHGAQHGGIGGGTDSSPSLPTDQFLDPIGRRPHMADGDTSGPQTHARRTTTSTAGCQLHGHQKGHCDDVVPSIAGGSSAGMGILWPGGRHSQVTQGRTTITEIAHRSDAPDCNILAGQNKLGSRSVHSPYGYRSTSGIVVGKMAPDKAFLDLPSRDNDFPHHDSFAAGEAGSRMSEHPQRSTADPSGLRSIRGDGAGVFGPHLRGYAPPVFGLGHCGESAQGTNDQRRPRTGSGGRSTRLGPTPPRFTRFIEAPSLADIRGATSQQHHQSIKPQLTRLPLHLKEVTHVNMEAVKAMINVHVQDPRHERQMIGLFAQRSIRWLEDDAPYEEAMARAETTGRRMRQERDSRTSGLSKQELKLVKLKRLAPATQPIKAWCRMCTTTEEARGRRRLLAEPFVNDVIDGEIDLQYCRSGGPPQTRKHVSAFEKMMQFDYRSWYDQLPFSERVRPYHGVRTAEGDPPFTLRSASMGGRGSCESGQGVTWTISTFDVTAEHCKNMLPLPDLILGVDFEQSTIIDNVAYFGHTDDDLERVGVKFLRRCIEVGAQVNDCDLSPEISDDELRAIVRKRISVNQTFGGEVYDLIQKTRALSDKTKDKLRLAQEVVNSTIMERARRTLSFRQWAAVFSLIFYATELASYPIDDDDNLRIALKQYAKLMRLTSSPNFPGWNYAAPADTFSLTSVITISKTLDYLITAAPCPVVGPSRNDQPAYTIITDASGWGYAGVVLCHESQSIRFVQGRWPGSTNDRSFDFHDTSVMTEPYGMFLVAATGLPANCTGIVRFITDHVGLVFAAHARLAWRSIACDAYAHTLRRLTATFPKATFIGHFIQGAHNPMDAASRGLKQAVHELPDLIAMAEREAKFPDYCKKSRQWLPWMR